MPKTNKLEQNLRQFREKLEEEPFFPVLENLMTVFPNAEIYAVGGAIRDAALGEREHKDYDFVVRNVPAKDLEKFLKVGGHTKLVGKSFGVFKCMPFGSEDEMTEPLDIALPRTEHAAEEGGGVRDFEVQSDPSLPIEEDLSRRDFTINAIAYNIKSGEIVDPHNGLEDLERKKIKAVGKPEERFREDYSRMLRAIRFACQLDFTVESKTLKTVKENIKRLNEKRKNGEWKLARETIAKETLKAFCANPVRAFDFYNETGAFKELMPEVERMKGCEQPENYHSEGDVFVHTRLSLEKLNSKEFKKYFKDKELNALLIMAVLFHDIGKPPTKKTPEEHGTDRIRFNEHDEVGAEMARKICRRLKLDSLPEDTPYHIDRDKLGWLIAHHLLLLQGEVERMKNSTIERYFFNPLKPGAELQQLTLADALATIYKDGTVDLTSFKKARKRIENLAGPMKEKARLPKPLLNGDEIMRAKKIKPGPEVGRLIELLREEQLSGRIKTKKQALVFLRSAD